jgi:hypothetical protein
VTVDQVVAEVVSCLKTLSSGDRLAGLLELCDVGPTLEREAVGQVWAAERKSRGEE